MLLSKTRILRSAAAFLCLLVLFLQNLPCDLPQCVGCSFPDCGVRIVESATNGRNSNLGPMSEPCEVVEGFQANRPVRVPQAVCQRAGEDRRFFGEGIAHVQLWIPETVGKAPVEEQQGWHGFADVDAVSVEVQHADGGLKVAFLSWPVQHFEQRWEPRRPNAHKCREDSTSPVKTAGFLQHSRELGNCGSAGHPKGHECPLRGLSQEVAPVEPVADRADGEGGQQRVGAGGPPSRWLMPDPAHQPRQGVCAEMRDSVLNLSLSLPGVAFGRQKPLAQCFALIHGLALPAQERDQSDRSETNQRQGRNSRAPLHRGTLSQGEENRK